MSLLADKGRVGWGLVQTVEEFSWNEEFASTVSGGGGEGGESERSSPEFSSRILQSTACMASKYRC